LWHDTNHWVDDLVRISKNWPAARKLSLFRELNWRLETAMVPAFAQLSEPFKCVLDETFDAVAGRQCVASPSDGFVGDQMANAENGDAWCEIAFSLLRDARESYDGDHWNKLKKQIDAVACRYAGHSERNSYETALWAIWNVERQQARDVLDRWQPSTRSPLAAIRKAGLLAELDELSEATSILRSALVEIRRALRIREQNVELLSLEGWCTYLLHAIEMAAGFDRFTETRDEFRERWQELKAWDCDPWQHTEYFGEALSAVRPELPKAVRKLYGFDPGSVTISRVLSSDVVGPLLPAFACIRLFELTGLPMRLRNVGIAPQHALSTACSWVAPYVGFWSPALLVRAGKSDELAKSEFLSRSQVARMDPSLAQRVYTWCFGILERELTELTGRTTLSAVRGSLLKVLTEVLSRLAFRVDAAELKRTLPIVLQIHQQPGVRGHIGLHDSCKPWFNRLFHAAEPELLLEWLPDLIRAPLYDLITVTVIPADQLSPDPMEQFPSWRVKHAHGDCSELVGKTRDAADWLLKRAESESGEARRRAVERLISVYRANLMTTDQQRRLGECLWDETNGESLPERPSFGLSGLLSLPVPPTVDLIRIIKNYILGLPSAGAVSLGANGSISVSIGPSEQRFIFEAASVSKPVIYLAGDEKGTIEWSTEETEQLYSKARDWWNNDKAVLLHPERASFISDVASYVKNVVCRIGTLLARAVLPKMESASEESWQELLAWLSEMRALGTFPTVALPYILVHRRAEFDAVAEVITADINSDNDEAVATSARAIRHWIRLSSAGLVPCPPPSLTMSLVERVIFRRKPGIVAAVSHVANLLVEQRDAISKSNADLLAASLISWRDTTSFTAPLEASDEFPEAERPQLRTLVAGLAGALRFWYSKSGQTDCEPPSVALWSNLCESDPLPEVRRSFDVWSNFKG
jgi:hypothetical protein